MERDFSNFCPVCQKETDDINNYYCIMNNGLCDNCFPKKKLVRQKLKENPDPFAKWRKDRNKKALQTAKSLRLV